MVVMPVNNILHFKLDSIMYIPVKKCKPLCVGIALWMKTTEYQLLLSFLFMNLRMFITVIHGRCEQHL